MLSAAWRTSTKALITISLQGKRAHHFNVKPGKLFCGKRHSHHFLFCVNVEVWNTPYDDDDTHETRRSYMTDSWSCERFPPAKRPRCPHLLLPLLLLRGTLLLLLHLHEHLALSHTCHQQQLACFQTSRGKAEAQSDSDKMSLWSIIE